MLTIMRRLRRKARRVRDLTTRQNIALVASALLGVAIFASAAAGWQRLATVLVGLTVSLALLATIQLHAQIKDLARRLGGSQRRILASIENERLMAADRQSALEFGQRRIVAALENERLAAVERQHHLENGQRTLISRLSETHDSLQDVINTSALKSIEDIVAQHRD